MKGSRKATAHGMFYGLMVLAFSGLCAAQGEPSRDFIPLPGQGFGEGETGNPVLDMRDQAVNSAAALQPVMPDALQVSSEGAAITYDSDTRIIRYDGNGRPVKLTTDSDGFMDAAAVQVDLNRELVDLDGPVTAYQGDILVKTAQGGTYAWKTGEAALSGIRAKVNGLIIKGSAIEYHTDDKGRKYVVIRDAFVTTEDAEKPSNWVGVGTLTIYPGDEGQVSRLMITGKDTESGLTLWPSWFPLVHSLNPREGYLPNAGSRTIWGTYLLNSYGFLIGNKRVEKGIPTADYLATVHADYRTRRGAATGLDFEELALAKKYTELKGLRTYFLSDDDPSINSTNIVREHTDHERYRIALQQEFAGSIDADPRGKWKLAANVNILSDRYVLRDFFEDEARTDNEPDNTVRLTRLGKDSQFMVYGRFAPNDFYETDERAEMSFYHVRTAIGNTGINYETNNSATLMRQYLPLQDRILYQDMLSWFTDSEITEYLRRKLNTQSYTRLNSTHEFTTSFKPLRFLNITPKTGVGYTGYYDVGGIGSDNRFLGYIGCDFDAKFNRRYSRFAYHRLGLKGLTHVIRPYVTYSQATISSSNKLVPRVDYWSSSVSGSTLTPRPLDFIGYNGIDGWGQWTVFRLGVQNVLHSEVDGERIRLLNWNVFVDVNADDTDSDDRCSNLYNLLTFQPSKSTYFRAEAQTPTIENGYGYYQYDLSGAYMPFAWLESRAGYRCINNHPLLRDAEQVYLQTNLRLDERHTVSGRWYFDMEQKRAPIQEYSVFRNCGPWYIGATLFLRDNGGRKEEGFGISFTLGETGTALPVKFF